MLVAGRWAPLPVPQLCPTQLDGLRESLEGSTCVVNLPFSPVALGVSPASLQAAAENLHHAGRLYSICDAS